MHSVHFKVVAAMAVIVLALTVIVLQIDSVGLSGPERAYADLRFSFAADSSRVLGSIDAELFESSGIAVSRAHPGIIWSHNDSGDDARFFALDSTGAAIAVFDVTGVEARDWEDMDLGPCPADATVTCLYLADIGDNVRRRDILTVHVVPEPDPAEGSGSVEPLGRLRYLYPDQSHDAEALAVGPAGDVVIVTKGRTPDILLFHLDAAAFRAAVATDEPIRLGAGVRLPIEPDWDVGRVVTGASFRPDGGAIAVRTLSEVYFFAWPGLEQAAPPCFLGNREPQGEGVSWDPGGSLLLSSETTPRGAGMLTRVWCARD